jgi:hypothetical protein
MNGVAATFLDANVGESKTMESIKELADAIYRERVLRARRTPIE